MSTTHPSDGHTPPVRWITDDIEPTPAAFTMLNGYLLSVSDTEDTRVPRPVHWAISQEDRLIQRGVEATVETARRVALSAAGRLFPVWAT